MRYTQRPFEAFPVREAFTGTNPIPSWVKRAIEAKKIYFLDGRYFFCWDDTKLGEGGEISNNAWLISPTEESNFSKLSFTQNFEECFIPLAEPQPEQTPHETKNSDLVLDEMFKITYAELTKTKVDRAVARDLLNQALNGLSMTAGQIRNLEGRLSIAEAKLSVLALIDRCFGKQDFGVNQCSPGEPPMELGGFGLGWLSGVIERTEEYFEGVKQQEYAEQHFNDAGLPKEVGAYGDDLTRGKVFSGMTATEMSNHLDELERCEKNHEMWRIRVQEMREKCGLDKHPSEA